MIDGLHNVEHHDGPCARGDFRPDSDIHIMILADLELWRLKKISSQGKRYFTVSDPGFCETREAEINDIDIRRKKVGEGL